MKDKVKFNVPEEGKSTLPDDIKDEVISTDPEEVETIEDAQDNIETVEDDTKEAFYTSGEYNELRDAMEDTDFRLFLIGNDIVIPGTLDGDKIQFLDIVDDDDDKEFVLKPAPNTMNEVLDFKTLYNISNSEVEIPEGKEVSEAPHQDIVEYILNLKVSDKDTDDVEDDEQEIKTKENEENKEEDTDESNE